MGLPVKDIFLFFFFIKKAHFKPKSTNNNAKNRKPKGTAKDGQRKVNTEKIIILS